MSNAEEQPQIDNATENAIPAKSQAPSLTKESIAEGAGFDPTKLGILNDVSVTITIEIGRTQIKIRDLLNLTKDSIIDLNKLAGEPVDVYANGKLISKGNIITANGKYCVRLISVPTA